jgi:ElaB/YqjD/DUF883 family membrane-anchored ribosome-binding protein
MNAELNTEQLVTDLKRVVRDSESLLAATTDSAGAKAGAVRERLGEALESARRTCLNLEERAVENVKAADQMIRKHPYPSIGVAFGVGLLIGVLVNRK